MTRLSADQPVDAHPPEQATSAEVLAEAVRLRRPVQISSATRSCAVIATGEAIEYDGKRLTISMPSWRANPEIRSTDGGLRISLDVGQVRYVFDTNRIECADSVGQSCIRVLAPSTIILAERRKSPRRQLRKTTQITLSSTSGRDQWRCVGSLLNLSPEGMACRIPEGEAQSPDLDQIVDVRFQLDDHSPEFELGARVVTRQHGSSRGQTLVGLEFVTDQRLQTARSRLEGALVAPR